MPYRDYHKAPEQGRRRLELDLLAQALRRLRSANMVYSGWVERRETKKMAADSKTAGQDVDSWLGDALNRPLSSRRLGVAVSAGEALLHACLATIRDNHTVFSNSMKPRPVRTSSRSTETLISSVIRDTIVWRSTPESEWKRVAPSSPLQTR